MARRRWMWVDGFDRIINNIEPHEAVPEVSKGKVL